MSTGRLRAAAEYPESARKLFGLSEGCFNYEFAELLGMSRVTA